MVSAIWNAASEGNFEAVKQILQDHPGIDVEIKDHTGATPLIQAIRNGHTEIAAELLNTGGANPFNSSSQGDPESFTSDEAILQLLAEARDTYVARTTTSGNETDAPQTPLDSQPNGYHGVPYDPAQAYYRPMPPPGTEHPGYTPGYYVTEGGYFIVPPPQPVEYPPPAHFRGPSQQHSPTEPTKNIPCRYFPNCRYGASCHFAHPALPPQPGFYGAPPPHPYSPYDPNAPVPYNPQFYPGHPNFPPPHQIIPPPPSSQSDVTSPVQSPEGNGQFSPVPPVGYMMAPYPIGVPPNGVPAGAYAVPFPSSGAPGAYPGYPYPPPSPTRQRNGEQQQQQQQPQPIPVYPYQPYAVATTTTTSSPTTAVSPTNGPTIPSSTPATETEFRKASRDSAPGTDGQPVGYPNGNGNGNGPRHSRELSYSQRRPNRLSMSFNGPRRGPSAICMFFPSGKCRNGDECRFAHVLPEDGQAPPRQVPYGLKKYRERGYSASGPQDDRRGEFEVRYPSYGGPHPDKASIAQALASLPSNMKSLNLSNGRNNSNARNGNSSGVGSGPTSAGPASAGGFNKLQSQQQQNHQSQQRVPSEEDFPSLGGVSARTSPITSIASNGGKTAAQILKSSPAGGNSSNGKFRPKDSTTPRSGDSSSSEKTTDVESVKSVGSNGTDQLTRPTSPEDAAEFPKVPITTTVETPPIAA